MRASLQRYGVELDRKFGAAVDCGSAVFVVQESIHADWVSRHETRGGAIAAIEEMIRKALAEPGELNWIRRNELAANAARRGKRSTR